MSMEIDRLKKKCPADWDILPFTEAVRDVTAGNSKVKQGDYRKQGALAIIDQGQDLIGGYTDDESLACKETLPCIVFGDHTKIFKYIEHPFALGADGVKILAPIGKFDKRFLYHYLKTLRLPDNEGYSRHYKFLKESLVVKPPLAKQKRIAAILDKADAIRRKRHAALKLADDFLRATFLDMFGDPVTNTKGWPVGTIRELINEAKYGTAKKASPTKGKFPVLRMNNITYSGEMDFTDLKYVDLEKKEEDKYLARRGDLLFNRTNSKKLVGKTAVFEADTPMAIAGYLIRVRTNEKATPHYISAYLNSRHGKQTLMEMCKSIVGMANINAQELQDIKILIPPIEIQNRFSEIVRDVRKGITRQLEAANTGDGLFNSLTQLAFRGEL